jgi:hypothetical protein
LLIKSGVVTTSSWPLSWPSSVRSCKQPPRARLPRSTSVASSLVSVSALLPWSHLFTVRSPSKIHLPPSLTVHPVSENAPRAIRGALTGIYQLFITAGIMLAFWINYGSNAH